MKNLFKIYLIVFVSTFTSCKKVLETEPTDFLSPENYYKTAEELQSGVNGIYDILGSKPLYKQDMLYAFNASSDEAAFNIWLSNGGLAYAFYEYTSSTPEVGEFWGTLYSGIFRANTLLANIDKPKMAEDKRNIMKGEALFLRGYYYFLLVSNFGDVPLILTPTSSVINVSVARTPTKQVYDQILKDMTEAESLLQAQTVTKLKFSGKVSKTAVQGILARVCLQMAGEPLKDVSKYHDAKAWAYKVITSGEHALNPDYSNIFIKLARDEYDVKESIWEVEFYGNGTASSNETNQSTGFYIGIACQDEAIGYSTARVNVTKKLYDTYEVINPASTASIRPTLDLRRDWNCANYTWGTTIPGTRTAVTSQWLMNVGKWRREYETLTPKGRTVNGINVSLLRYSDVLLMYAEAANEVNNEPTDSAYQAVNLVRQRAFGKVLNGNVIKNINVVSQGTGYVAATTTVTISGGGATENATATATVTSGRITAINITSRGKFYQDNPTVTITGAGTGATTTVELSTMTDADLPRGLNHGDFFDVLVDERSRELCFEGYRRMDLLRWGKFVSTMQSFHSYARNNGASSTAYRASGNVTGRNVLMPIPSNDLILNKSLTQNPGW